MLEPIQISTDTLKCCLCDETHSQMCDLTIPIIREQQIETMEILSHFMFSTSNKWNFWIADHCFACLRLESFELSLKHSICLRVDFDETLLAT